MLVRWVLLVVLLLLVGCEPQIAPPLVEVTELTPREIEPGDRLEIHGTGFPQGRTGRVILEGSVSRPGEPPTNGVSVEAEGVVAAPDRLEIVVRDAFAERFCGQGEHGAHATFRGKVEVAFASNIAGAKPLVGTLRSTTIDVLPASPSATTLAARAAEGGRVLAFLGIVIGPEIARGLPIEKVQPGSPAERAGIQVGDVLASVDGVHVLSVGDVVPASARSADFMIRHGDSGEEETTTISLIDYSGERIPTEYAPALLVVGLAIALLVVLLLPGPPSLAAIEVQIASRVRRTTVRAMLRELAGGKHAPVSAILSAVLSTFALTPYVFGREVDGVVLLVSGGGLLVWSRLKAERGVVASMRTLLQTGLAVLTMAFALALTVGQVGAIELAELVRLQGGAPWQFTATRHPSCTVLTLVYGVAIVAILRTRQRTELLERIGVLVAAALGVMVFLGGWQLPGVLAPRQTSAMLLLAAAVFVTKTWIVASVLVATSRIAPSLRPREVQTLVVKRLLPALTLGAVLVVASRRFAPSMAIETAFGGSLVAVTALFLVRLGTRVRSALSRPEPHASTVL